MPFQIVRLCDASVISRTLYLTWLLCESDRCSSIHSIVSSSIV